MCDDRVSINPGRYLDHINLLECLVAIQVLVKNSFRFLPVMKNSSSMESLQGE